jgi:hypothetical protein
MLFASGIYVEGGPSLSSLQGAGGPFKPDVGLSGAVRRLDRVFPPVVHVFRAVHSDSI